MSRVDIYCIDVWDLYIQLYLFVIVDHIQITRTLFVFNTVLDGTAAHLPPPVYWLAS